MQDIRIRDSLGNAVVRLFRQVNRRHNRALRPHGISVEQAHILMVLWGEGPITIGHLQRLLSLSSATLTGAIDRMETAELVRRVPDPNDRRAVRIEPVRMLPRRRRAIEATLLETEAECFGGLSTPERRELLRLMVKAEQAIQAPR